MEHIGKNHKNRGKIWHQITESPAYQIRVTVLSKHAPSAAHILIATSDNTTEYYHYIINCIRFSSVKFWRLGALTNVY